MNTTRFIYIAIILLALLAGCSKKSQPAMQQPETIEAAIPVMVENVQKRDLDRYVRVAGKLEGIVDITMVSETSGKVVSIEKSLGDWVTKGDPIGSVDNTTYRIALDQAKASLLAAEGQYEAAEATFNATENLYNDEKVSLVDYASAKSSFKSALAQLEGAKANVETAQKAYDNSRFLAPVSGYISYLPIEVGQFVSAGSIVCTIVNSKRLVVKSGVNESDIMYIKKGQAVQIHHVGSEDIYDGRVTGVGISQLAGTASYPIEIEMDNPNGKLYPGMVIEAKIKSQTFENVIYTALSNVKMEYDEPYVFVASGDRVKHIPITLGITIDENVIIAGGLSEGEQLVTEGIDNLEDGSLIDIRKAIGK